MDPPDGFVRLCSIQQTCSYASIFYFKFLHKNKNKRTFHGTVSLSTSCITAQKSQSTSTVVRVVCYPNEGGNSFISKGSDFIPRWDRLFTTLTTFFSIICHITNFNMVFDNKALWECMAGISLCWKDDGFFSSSSSLPPAVEGSVL